MGAGHGHQLYRQGDSPVHRLPPYVKLVATFAFVVAVVATPRAAFWAFGVHAALLLLAIRAAGLRAGTVARRMVVELPFVAFAVILPFVATGPRVDVAGLSLSEPGLLGAWNIMAKGTLGVVATIVLSATTELRSLVASLQRLHVPQMLVQIMTFMIRYADVVGDEMRRMHVARQSRGFAPRDVRHLKVVARSAGALFIRAFERGERVYLAMVSRGYTGSLPVLDATRATSAEWATAAALPVAASCVAVAAWVTL
ncbi:MAG: cobalt ECF transporter T component CbiQ [Actinomycetes bacterium]